MDDDMEGEIICELVFSHFHLLWKFIGSTSSNFVDMLLTTTSQSIRTKMFHPGPFLMLTFVIILCSLFLQSGNNRLSQLFLSLQHTIYLNVAPNEARISNIMSSSTPTENASDYYCDGIAGVYALQGRRGTMEDRFCVMQEVPVGNEKNLSFFGVYDGHGGQFVAEYVKQNLFTLTIEKIRQLRSSFDNNNKKKGNHNANNKVKKSLKHTKKQEDKSNKDENNIETESDKSECESKDDVKINKKYIKNTKKETQDVKSNINTAESSLSEGCSIEEIKSKEKEEKEGNTQDTLSSEDNPMKKEDPYSTLSLRKRHSLVTNSEPGRKQKDSELKSEESQDNMYIDNCCNINYTKLIKDQIAEMDNQVVEKCKSLTDVSGTTAVIAILDGELLIIGNVGDSRAVMGDLRGSTIPLSFDHKPNQLKERRRIKEAGGFITFTGVWRVAGILATSRALGDFPLKDPRKLVSSEPDVLTFSLKDHRAHFVILATDGLWDVLTNEEAVTFIQEHIDDKDFGAKALASYAYSKGSQDNITVAVINLSKVHV